MNMEANQVLQINQNKLGYVGPQKTNITANVQSVTQCNQCHFKGKHRMLLSQKTFLKHMNVRNLNNVS